MNKLKTYTEYIILAAVAALLLLYIIFRSAGNINYELPSPSSVDHESISRIVIDGPVYLEFSKTGDQWFIEPEGWHADPSNLTAISKALGEMKIADLISTSGNPGLYSLDESQRILVKAWSGEDLVREVWVGKVSSNGIYTYMMFPGDDNIYSVRGNLPSRVQDKKSMRDKRFIQLDRKSVLKMSLNNGGGNIIELFRDPEEIWHSNSFEADDAAVKAAVNMLDPLRCKDFLYEPPAEQPQWTMEILTEDNATTVLEIWPKTSGDIYPARCSQNGYFVQTTPYAVEKLLGAFGISFDDE